jgi:hypothetical protein
MRQDSLGGEPWHDDPRRDLRVERARAHQRQVQIDGKPGAAVIFVLPLLLYMLTV